MGEQETDRVLYSGSLNIKDVSRLSLKYIYVTELGEAGSWQGEVVATAAGPGHWELESQSCIQWVVNNASSLEQ